MGFSELVGRRLCDWFTDTAKKALHSALCSGQSSEGLFRFRLLWRLAGLLLLRTRAEYTSTRCCAAMADLHILLRKRAARVVSRLSRSLKARAILEIVVVCELFTCQNTIIPSEQSHSWLSPNVPFFNAAIWTARMVDKTSDGATSSIDDHVLIKHHKVIALIRLAAGYRGV